MTDAFASQLRQFASFMNSDIAFAVATVGIILNLFSVYVFRRGDKGQTPAIHYYLITLTVWHSGVLLCVLLHSLPILIFGKVLPFANYIYVYIAVFYGGSATTTGTIWILLTLTVDRFMALCYPIRHRVIGTRSRVKKAVILISIGALLFAVPKLFEVHIEERCNVTCTAALARTDLAKSTAYWLTYRVILNYLFVSVLPCTLLCLLTTRISVALKSEFTSRRALLASRTSTTSEQVRVKNKELRANVLLVAIIAKSIVCSVIPTLFSLIRLAIGAEKFTGPYVGIFYVFNDFLSALDCATNFLVFVVYGRKFRQTIKIIFFTSCLGKLVLKVTGKSMEYSNNDFKSSRSSSRTNATSLSDKNSIRMREAQYM